MKVEHPTFQTHWVKGKENIEADALSHNPCADEIDEVFHAEAINMVILDKLLSDYPSHYSSEVASVMSNAIASSDTSSALVNAVNAEYLDMN
jgi:hypothetical protein